MFDVCVNCGEYDPDKPVDPSGPFVLCPSCGYKREFLMLPLFIITGSSGTGKSVIWNTVLASHNRPDVVYLDSDMLWREEFARTGEKVCEYRDLWLYVCCNISQSGRPVALFGSASPEQFENCRTRKYFSRIHYLALTCDAETLRERLRSRPSWRQSSNPAKIEHHIDWNQRFIENEGRATPEYSTLDTSKRTPQECTQDFMVWVSQVLAEGGL